MAVANGFFAGRFCIDRFQWQGNFDELLLEWHKAEPLFVFCCLFFNTADLHEIGNGVIDAASAGIGRGAEGPAQIERMRLASVHLDDGEDEFIRLVERGETSIDEVERVILKME